jgi:hypothetical protein
VAGIIELLQRRGLQKIAKVKIVRHQDKRKQYDLQALIAKGHFEAGYQAYQVRLVFNCDYIVSCIGLPKCKAWFFGVYRVVGQRPAEEVPLPPHLAYLKDLDPPGWAHPGLIWYDLAKLGGFADLKGAVIDWGPGARVWVQWLTVENDKKVIQMPHRVSRPPVAL